MLNFYPGPSRLHDEVGDWLREAYASGIWAMNHRSEAFMTLWANTRQLLQQKLEIPAEYEIYAVSSATEGWEVVNQSLGRRAAYFYYNGAFGEKWAKYARKSAAFRNDSSFIINDLQFSVNEIPQVKTLTDARLICLTHNETSNGTLLPDGFLGDVRRKNPHAIIAVDATSSMSGIALPWAAADVWLASVQKCFGLPPGLGLLIVSPQALTAAANENDHYNSLVNLRDNFRKNQTPYTPNTPGITLLNRWADFTEPATAVGERIIRRAEDIYRFIETQSKWKLLVENPAVRSPTVITVSVPESELNDTLSRFEQRNIIVGKGYGEWKNNTFRIANFPAIPDEEFAQLFRFMN